MNKEIFLCIVFFVYLFFSQFRESVAADWAIESPATATHLVELYSSEGCRSCPPAEEWMTNLRKESGLWKEFIPIEFHIDYWNRLGWHDPFSEDRFSDRQRNLAKSWGSDSVYTPGFALDGKEWRTLFRNRGLHEKTGEVGILRARRKNKNSFGISFSPAASLQVERKEFRVYGALLGNGFVTEVKSGENAGKTLKHDFVVTQFASAPLIYDPGKKIGIGTLELDPKGSVHPKSESIVFWVTPLQSEMPLQAVGADLNN